MKPRVYIETTIPSYLTGWTSQVLLRAAHQQATREWWETRRGDFDLFISDLVIRECEDGDPAAAALRLAAIDGIPTLDAGDESVRLSRELLATLPLPAKAAGDALHVAIAIVGRMDYLLTWNCTHIANAMFFGRIEDVCRRNGFVPPRMCTPINLLPGA